MESNNDGHLKGKRIRSMILKTSAVTLFFSCMVYAVSETRLFAKVFKGEAIEHGHKIAKDSVTSVKAFAKVYEVLQSPRCVNCHPSGDVPLQGDDRKIHAMHPRRGEDGKGILTMKCTNCHQPENTAGIHTPPGSPNWHLPPANMKMVFEGKNPGELARQLIDPKQNGNKDMKALIAHADDALVKWGWKPGDGRTLPPYSHKEFKEAWITWLKTGAYAPAK
ncbi:hypothetical protein D3C86_1399620 [compost metagenome]